MPTLKARPRILVICDYYLPGSKGGGGTRTLVNMVERMSEDYDFLIMSRDHDGPLDRRPYEGITYRIWMRVGPASVRYMAGNELGIGAVVDAVKVAEPELLYFNSVFSRLTWTCLVAKKLGLITQPRIVLAPCGELGAGALAIKSWRKRFFLRATHALGLYDGILWKASTASEAEEIRAVFGDVRLRIAPDVGRGKADVTAFEDVEKVPGRLRLVYLSRITPKKNLLWLVELMGRVQDGVTLDVYGDTDSPSYEQSCRAAACGAPVSFHGALDHSKVAETLSRYDVLVLPTLNENYGHVIFEALGEGLPVVISDRTPWTGDLRGGPGFALPLDEKAWLAAFDTLSDMGGDDFASLREAARAFACRVSESNVDIQTTAKVLDDGLGGTD